MTEQEIKADYTLRKEQCESEIETVLRKYEMGLTAEDNITPFTRLNVLIRFVDLKKYDAEVAQEQNAIKEGVSDGLIAPATEPIINPNI